MSRRLLAIPVLVAVLSQTGIAHAAETDLPAPTSVVARATFTGTDLTWAPPTDNPTGEGITGYVVPRDAGGADTTYPVTPQFDTDAGGPYRWTDSHRTADATYTVAAVYETGGEGISTAAVTASPTTDVVTTSTRSSLNGPGYLAQTAIPDGVQPVGVDAPPATVNLNGVSADGRSVLYADAAPGGGRVLRSLRTDAPGTFEPKDVFTTTATDPGEFAISPDGLRVAYTRQLPSTVRCLDIAVLSTGVATEVGCGLTQPAWLADGKTLVAVDGQQQNSPLVRVAAKAGRSVLGTYTGTTGARHPAVSPDGRWLAYANSTDHPGAISIRPADGSGTAAHTPQLGATTATPTWNPDGTQLAALVHLTFDGDRVVRIPVGATGVPAAAVPQLVRAYDRPVLRAFWQGPRVAIAPFALTTGPAVSIGIDASALPAGTVVTCQLDATPAAACGPTYSRTGLTNGTHRLVVRAVEPGGRTSIAVRTFDTDAVAPVTTLTAPTFGATLAATARIAYTATDASGVASYDVRYRRSAYNGGFGAYVQPWTATKATAVSLALSPGYEYCVQSRARDGFGNVSAWTAERCFARAVDDTSLLPSSGWTRSKNSVSYQGTIVYSSKSGAALTRAVIAKRVWVVATQCPGCGVIAVYLGGTRLLGLNLSSTTIRRQVLLPLPVQSVLRSGTLRIAITSTTGHLVQIDGFAARRT